MLPQGLCTLYAIMMAVKNRPGCGDALCTVILAQLYHLAVPEASIYWAAKALFFGENKEIPLKPLALLDLPASLMRYISFSVFCKYL